MGKVGGLKKTHFVAFLLYTLIAIGMTAPLALHLPDHLLGTDSNATNDTFFSVWIFGWQAHQLISDPLNLFQGNIFYPFQNSLAFSEIILPGALLYLPLEYASGNPILAYNLVLLLSFPLTAWATYLFVLDWLKQTADGEWRMADGRAQTIGDTRQPTDRIERLDAHVSQYDSPSAIRYLQYAAFLAGIIFAFCTYKIGELRHIQLLMAMFMPLTLMYLGKFLRTPNLHNGFLTALFFALNALSSLYYAVFLAFAIALYLVVEFLLKHLRITRAHLIYGSIALIIAIVLVLPFLLPFFRLERQYNFSEGRDPNLYSARPASYLAAPASQWLYGNLTRGFYVAAKGQPLFPGIAAVLLGVVGIFALWRIKSRVWVFPLLLALMAIILSFGPYLILDRTTTPAFRYPLPYYLISLVVSPLKSLNAPARFVVLAMLALGMLAAYGGLWLMRRFPRFSLPITGVCALLILLEYVPIPLRLAPVDAAANISPVYTYLAQQPPGEPVVEIPMGKPEFADQDKYVVYTYNSLYHFQPLVNGYSTFLPPDYYALVKDVQNFPTKASVQRLKKWGVNWVVVHSDRFPTPDKTRQKLARLAGIEHIRDFGNIWLYRIVQ